MFCRKRSASFCGSPFSSISFLYCWKIRWIDQNRDGIKILCRCESTRTTNINIFYRFFFRRSAVQLFLEKDKIDHNQINCSDLMFRNNLSCSSFPRTKSILHVLRDAMSLPTIQHFGKTRDISNILYGSPTFSEQLLGSSSRNQFNSLLMEKESKIGNSCFIRY